MASCITTQFGDDFCPQFKLTVTTSNSTDTELTFNYKLQYITQGSPANTSKTRDYKIYIDGTVVKSGSYDIDGKTGSSYTVASGSKTLTRETSAKDVVCKLWIDWDNFNWHGTTRGEETRSLTIVMSARASYTLKLNLNGGSGNITTSYTHPHSGNTTLPFTGITKQYHTFLGWSKESDATSATWTSSGDKTYSINASDTLYAVWKPWTFSIKYYSNYATSKGASTDITNFTANTQCLIYTRTDRTFTTSSSDWLKNYSSSGDSLYMTRTNYEPTGYWKNSDGSHSLHEDGVTTRTGAQLLSLFEVDLKDGAVLNLYAGWKKKTYTITYVSNETATGIPVAQTKTHGENLTLTSSKPTRSGWEFSHWKADFGLTFNPGANFSVDQNVTMTAIWRKKVTLTYNSNGGSSVTAQNDYLYSDKTSVPFKLATSTKANYILDGWTVNSKKYTAGTTIQLSANATATAVWLSTSEDYMPPVKPDDLQIVDTVKMNLSNKALMAGTFREIESDNTTAVTGIKMSTATMYAVCFNEVDVSGIQFNLKTNNVNAVEFIEVEL